MRNILQLIKSLCKIARLLSSDDSGNFQQGLFFYMGSRIKGQIWVPYGTIGSPPNDAQMLAFAQNGNTSNCIAFASDPKNRTVRDTKPGEYGIANYTTGDYFLFRNEDGAQLVTSKLTITTGAVTVVIDKNGMAISGGTVTHNGITIGDNHIHSQVNDGGGDVEQDTGAPHS